MSASDRLVDSVCGSSSDVSSSDDVRSECLATYCVVSMGSSRSCLNETRFGCGKKTFRLDSLGLALTEAALGGRGEFFRMGLMPNGNA